MVEIARLFGREVGIIEIVPLHRKFDLGWGNILSLSVEGHNFFIELVKIVLTGYIS